MRDEEKTKEELIEELGRAREQLARRETAESERKQAEYALTASLDRIEQAKQEWESTADSIFQLVCMLDNRKRVIRANRTVEAWNLGCVATVRGRGVHDLVHPACADPACYLTEFLASAWRDLIHGGTAECEAEDPLLSRCLHWQIRPVSAPAHCQRRDAASFAVVVIDDVTERKRLEDQLRQAHKMEAIGRLAGGIAHDLSNLLTVITSHGELALEVLGTRSPVVEHIEEIRTASDCAASLTERLLAFGRRRVVQPQALDLNAVVTNMAKLLSPLTGEAIQIVPVLAPNPGSVRADPGQMEQVIMNLLLNARDAMPQGGRVGIETKGLRLDEGDARAHPPARPGEYVMLAVSDAGRGMDKQTLSRVFEPFFTAKPQGQGTGLGLSTVYGIVQQCGGHIAVYSEPGEGSTFEVYLPKAEGAHEPTDERPVTTDALQGAETILLVEDEEAIRRLAQLVLRRSGYAVLTAADGVEGLAVSQQHDGPIDLLLTDVILPKMNGRKLAERIGPDRPTMKVLYMSGYADDVMSQQERIDLSVDFIRKPYTPVSLAREVRRVLDAPTRA